jgi:hypothetical protein
LVQHKGHKRTGEARKWFSCALHIGLKIAILFRCTDRKWKFFNTRCRFTIWQKKCPAPQSQAYNQRLVLFLTHLSFRWTLPLKEYSKARLFWSLFYLSCHWFICIQQEPVMFLNSNIIVILWRSCNLTAFIHSSTSPVVHMFASRHEGPRFNPHGGTYVKPRLSC